MFAELISGYKRRRTASRLVCRYTRAVAFVGLGGHSLANLYPVIEQLRVPLRYVCVRSPHTASLAARRFAGTQVVDSLEPILADPEVAAVFVATPPASQYRLAGQVLESGKALFVEKPPCRTLDELDRLVAIRHWRGNPPVQVGLQKRYAPAVQTLLRHMRHRRPEHYTLCYCTGAYPEGNELTDLFIHPLDLAVFLFGPARVAGVVRSGWGTRLVQLEHQGVVGSLELSTAYSWQHPQEELTVVCRQGLYRMLGTERLVYTPFPPSVAGIPTEKVLWRHPAELTLYRRELFSPVAEAGLWVSAGFRGEVEAFLDVVEGHSGRGLASLESVRGTYALMQQIG